MGVSPKLPPILIYMVPLFVGYIYWLIFVWFMDVDRPMFTQPEVIELSEDDASTIVISSDQEDDTEDLEWLEEIRVKTREMKKEIIRQACSQLAEELINKN